MTKDNLFLTHSRFKIKHCNTYDLYNGDNQKIGLQEEINHRTSINALG